MVDGIGISANFGGPFGIRTDPRRALIVVNNAMD
jgi:hypothetical protein